MPSDSSTETILEILNTDVYLNIAAANLWGAVYYHFYTSFTGCYSHNSLLLYARETDKRQEYANLLVAYSHHHLGHHLSSDCNYSTRNVDFKRDTAQPVKVKPLQLSGPLTSKLDKYFTSQAKIVDYISTCSYVYFILVFACMRAFDIPMC